MNDLYEFFRVFFVRTNFWYPSVFFLYLAAVFLFLRERSYVRANIAMSLALFCGALAFAAVKNSGFCVSDWKNYSDEEYLQKAKELAYEDYHVHYRTLFGWNNNPPLYTDFPHKTTYDFNGVLTVESTGHRLTQRNLIVYKNIDDFLAKNLNCCEIRKRLDVWQVIEHEDRIARGDFYYSDMRYVIATDVQQQPLMKRTTRVLKICLHES